MFKKRGQGLSINVIIIAIIALIVLVVLIAILTGKLGVFSAGVESVASCENACKGLGKDGGEDARCSGGQKIPGDYTDAPAGCCCT